MISALKHMQQKTTTEEIQYIPISDVRAGGSHHFPNQKHLLKYYYFKCDRYLDFQPTVFNKETDKK